MAEPSPNKGVFRWTWARARARLNQFLLGGAGLTLAVAFASAFLALPSNPTLIDRLKNGAVGAGMAIAIVIVATMSHALLRAPYEQRNVLRSIARISGQEITTLQESLSHKPLDAKHEAELRAAMTKMFVHPGNLELKDRMSLDDLKAHFPDRQIWTLRDELFALATQHQELYDAYNREFKGALINLGLESYERQIDQIMHMLLLNKASRPEHWNRVPHDKDRVVLRVANSPVAGPVTPSEAEDIQAKLVALVQDIPNWESRKRVVQPDERSVELRKLMRREITDLELASFDGTGPCSHC